MNHCEVVERAALAALPELGPRLYVVDGARCEGNLARVHVGGWTGPVADVWLKPVIGERWTGRGPCLVVQDATDIQDTGDVVAHEIAHILDEGWTYDRPEEQTYKVRKLDDVANALELGVQDDQNPLLMLGSHRLSFIRAAVHVSRRMLDFRPYVGCNPLQMGRPYGVSWLGYLEIFCSEKHNAVTRKVPIREVLKTWPMPQAAIELYQADLDRAAERQREKEAAEKGGIK